MVDSELIYASGKNSIHNKSLKRNHPSIIHGLLAAIAILSLLFIISGCGQSEQPASDIDKWISQLAGDDQAQRQEAMDNLVAAGGPAVEPLIAVFVGGNQELSLLTAARDTLVEIGEPAAEPLVESLSYTGVKQATALKWKQEALEQIGEPSVEPLIAALRKGDEMVRVTAAESLASIGDSAAVPVLIQALKDDESVDVRVAAAESLGSMGDASAIPPLGRALGDEYPVQKAAEKAILEIKKVTGKVPEAEDAYQSCIELTVKPLTDPLGAVISPEGEIVNTEALSGLADDEKLTIGYALSDCIEIRR